MSVIAHDSTYLESDEYHANLNAYKALLDTFYQKRDQLLQGGSLKKKDKHLKSGKQLPRWRIEQLLDPKTKFYEIGLFAACNAYDGNAPTAALITGIGTIEGQKCMIIANDPTIKGGCFFPLTVKKHLRAQAIARKHHLPCLYLVDSGGAYLPMQDQVFPDKDHFGRIFFEQAQMSAMGIPQIAVVLGSCTAGGAYVPAMADQSIMVKNQATVFLAGPPLVKAATGEEVSAEALGGADLHCRKSGVADYLAIDESDALNQARMIVCHLPKSKTQTCHESIQPPRFSADAIYGHISHDPRYAMDVMTIIGHLVDDSAFHAFKAHFGPTLICGFAKMGGHTVGILANQGVLLPESAQKGAHFIELCAQRHIPLIFLQNITGFMVGKSVEEQGIAKHGAKMVMAVANANVPKLTVFMGSSFGAGNYAMCGSAYDPNFTFIWPNAIIAVMGGEQASGVLAQIGADHDTDTIKAAYESKSNAYHAASELWADCLIDPADTRDYLIEALDLCATLPEQKTSFGVFRM